VLERVVRWTGVDRAFLAEGSPRNAGAVLRAGVSRHGPGAGDPSRTAMTRAVAGRRSFLSAAPADDPRLADGASVRRLGLGFVAAFPLPGKRPPAAALLLDAAAPLREGWPARVESGAEAVLPLLRLLLDAAPPAPPEPPPSDDREPLVGASAAFRAAVDDARRAAGSAVPVLLCGESGTGKELFARMIHRLRRPDPGPFVPVNCAAVPESLLEAELFGAVRGAYTGAGRGRAGLWTAAHGGTLFLDEIGEMPPTLQAKLLRVLQDGRVRPLGTPDETAVDVRVIAATHRDLKAAIGSRSFRADLYWRLAVGVVRIPPLRERPDDLVPLAEAILVRLSRRWGLPAGSLGPEAADRLSAHSWPGNVRELEAVLARGLLRAGGGTLRRRHLDFDPMAPAAEDGDSARSLEVRMVRAAMREAGGRLTPAAARIGWSRQKLYRRLRALGLDRWGDRTSPA
jgi:DNA-binding NtrC family response regulator